MAKRKKSKRRRSDENIEINITEILKILKKKYPYLLLTLFILFGY